MKWVNSFLFFISLFLFPFLTLAEEVRLEMRTGWSGAPDAYELGDFFSDAEDWFTDCAAGAAKYTESGIQFGERGKMGFLRLDFSDLLKEKNITKVIVDVVPTSSANRQTYLHLNDLRTPEPIAGDPAVFEFTNGNLSYLYFEFNGPTAGQTVTQAQNYSGVISAITIHFSEDISLDDCTRYELITSAAQLNPTERVIICGHANATVYTGEVAGTPVLKTSDDQAGVYVRSDVEPLLFSLEPSSDMWLLKSDRGYLTADNATGNLSFSPSATDDNLASISISDTGEANVVFSNDRCITFNKYNSYFLSEPISAVNNPGVNFYRVDSSAASDSLAIDASLSAVTPCYFDLYGRSVVNPEAGKIYILRSTEGSKLVIKK